MKLCYKCKVMKDESNFNKKKASKDGLDSICRDCQKEYDNSRKEKRKEYKKCYDEKYRELHREELKKKSNVYYHTVAKFNKSELTLEQKQYKSKIKKLWYDKNKQRIAKQKHDLRLNNPMFRLNESISANLYHALKSSKLENHWEILVGYTLKQLKEHLESQFDENMTWDNYGEYWEIDHIIPINTFNFISYEDKEFKICWSLINLRPLEKIANRSRPKDGSDISEELKNKILNEVG